VPDVNDLDGFSALVHDIKDSIGAKDYQPKGGV
jgi:hypothetical protein